MSEAAKQAAVHFLGPLFEPRTRGPETIVPSLMKEVLHFQSTSATLMFQSKRNPQMIQPHIQSTRSHAHPDTDTMLIHTHTVLPVLGGPVQPSSIPEFPGLQLLAKSQGCSADNDAGAPFSSSQLQHLDVDPSLN